MNVPKISSIDFNIIQNIMASSKISESQKTQFIENHKTQIEKVLRLQVTPLEFKGLMKNRPLRKFKPLRNSFTKRGDKMLLANTLGIEPDELSDYVEEIKSDLSEFSDLSFLPEDKLDAIKTYVYRHGSKDDIVAFLDYELRCAKDTLKTLYSTLEYHTGGIADYFIRPIHRMDNRTMVRLYRVIDKHLDNAKSSGRVTDEEYTKIAKWALVQIYRLQNNSKLINAIKTYKVLSE